MGLIAVGTALFAGGTAYQIYQQKKAESNSRRAAERAERARNARAARERRQQARQAILTQAQSEAAGVASGAGLGSSNVQGAIGAAGSQAAGNINFLNTQNSLANQINSFNL